LTNRGLEAPHRRAERASRGPQDDGSLGLRLGLRRATGRFVEKAAVRAYAATTWLVAHVPGPLSRWVIGTGSQAGYLFWPTKRNWSNANFGHVAGLPPDDPRVRRMALAAYREYARYLVEVMHLESMSAERASALVAQTELDGIEAMWRDSKGGLILALGHVGNNEAVAAAVAGRGWPVNVVADDSSFPEMFARFTALREAWGVHVIPWRNLREIFVVLKRREMLALLIDWGYRSDGIPVKLFDSWTTLPAGPASLAAKTGSRILPLTIRRQADGDFHVSWSDPIEVASSAPADLQAATQELADALAATIGAAPHQWYSFKPMWPDTAEEAAELEQRAATMQAGGPRADAAITDALAPGAAIPPWPIEPVAEPEPTLDPDGVDEHLAGEPEGAGT
jgi:phosphatidylinositol dimannoside acyltransferase